MNVWLAAFRTRYGESGQKFQEGQSTVVPWAIHSAGSLSLTKYLEPNRKEEVFDGALVLQLSPTGLVDVQYRVPSANP